MRGSIVKRKGSTGSLYYVVIRNKWYRVPDPQTKRSAEAFRAHLVAEAGRGALIEESSETLEAFVERWKAAHYSELSEYTIRSYDSALRTHILPALGARSLRTIAREDLERWIGDLRQKLAPRTVTFIAGVLAGILATAVSWRYLAKSPLEGVKRPRGARKREPAPLAPAAIRRLLEASEGLPRPAHWSAVIMITTTAGLRLGEVVAAKWANLDEAAGRYAVRESYTDAPTYKGFSRPKTPGSAASVVITPECMAALRRLKAVQAAEALEAGREPPALIFGKANGDPLPPRYVYDEFRRRLDAAGLAPVRFHDLRHTCAALWIALGEGPKFIQAQMRHATISTTFDTYGHLFEDDRTAAAERMDRLIRG